MIQNITVTTGIYNLIKDHIKRKKTTSEEEKILKVQLKHAVRIKRRHIPLDVVTTDAKVTVKNLDNDSQETFTFVAPHIAKGRNCRQSILSTMGLALVGCKVGDIIRWPFGQKEKQLQIINVERLSTK